MGPVICLVTDRRRFGQDAESTLVSLVAEAAQAGVHLVQVRERDLEARDLLRLVERCVEAVQGTRARVLVNDRLDIAVAANAHGVHLRGDSAPTHRVRRNVPPGFLVGRSVHSAEEAARHAEGADYLIAGTVFDSASKPGERGRGLAALQAVVSAVAIPVLAIGGVTIERLPEIAAAGASGFAAIGLFASAAEPTHTLVRKATLSFDRARPVS